MHPFLNGVTLQRKLAGGDLIAIDAVYQYRCLQAFHRRASKAEKCYSEETKQVGPTCTESTGHGIENNEGTYCILHVLSWQIISGTYSKCASGERNCPLIETETKDLRCFSVFFFTFWPCPKGRDIRLVFSDKIEDAVNSAVDHDSEGLLIAKICGSKHIVLDLNNDNNKK